ncbi:MAG TPA: APC family permease [Candidatus Tectomicrobia bacterium]
MHLSLRRTIFGSPLPTTEYVHQRLSKVKALAVFSSDALSSVAYATEEILLVLVTAGMAALDLSMPIALTITGLLVIVAASYYQTVHGYPSGGGSYIVAHENLGAGPGLVAAAALLIDYVLTVAVSITAGIVAVTSAFPALRPIRIELCLLAIALITWGNLRGVRESGTLFAVPTYAFLGLFLTLIVAGLAQLVIGTPRPVFEPMPLMEEVGSQPLTILLILRAFASGCAAMTGVEAISNGVPAFEKPEADNAGKTLILMACLLATMFLGITFLARTMGVVPVESESVVSQIGHQVFGAGPLYLALQAATALILILAANTAFADFPRLASILAQDGYAPRQLANLGDRLVFSNGIGALALLAALLIVIFRGKTHGLIPLYAVGVFLSFTLSQAGMVRRWQKLRQGRWRWKMAINGLGAVTTGLVLLVVIESKFTHGAWIILLLIPVLVGMFGAVKRHYLDMREQVVLESEGVRDRLPPGGPRQYHKVVVPISSLNRASITALRFARSLSRDVTAVIVDLDAQATARVEEQWDSWDIDIPLIVLKSPYRSVVRPLLSYLEQTDRRDPERGLAVVILPEIVPARWWQNLLHNQTTLLLKAVLLFRQARSGDARVVINVPYHLRG